MPKKNDNLSYWEKREIENITVEMMKDAEVAEHIKNLCDEMFIVIQKEIESMYARYATKEGISVTDAKKRISELDVEEYEKTVAKYVREKDFSDEANERLRLYNVTTRINREEYIKAMLNAHITALGSDVEKELSEYLDDATVRELKRQAGILGSISVERKDIKAIINSSHFGAEWSERLWSNMDDVRGVVDRMVKDSIIRGRHPQEYVGELKKLTGRTEYEARRLLITEASRVQIEAQKLSYLETGVLKYKYKAIMDNRTTETCKDLNNKVFKVKDMRIGINAPPMHAFCRSTTVPTTIDMDFDWKGKKGGILSIDDEEVVEDDAEEVADSENDAILDELDAMMARIDKLDNAKKKQAKKKIEAKVEKVTRQQPILSNNLKTTLNEEEQKNIIKQFHKGDERMVEVFNNYGQDVKLKFHRSGGAYYHPTEHSVYMNKKEMEFGASGGGKDEYSRTFYHEYGHAIDRILGEKLYMQDEGAKKLHKYEVYASRFFKNADGMNLGDIAKSEWKEFEKTKKAEYESETGKKLKIAEVRKRIADEVKSNEERLYCDLSDMVEGATNGALNFGWGHGKSYWNQQNAYLTGKSDNLSLEIFAELYSMMVTSQEALDFTAKYLPETVNMMHELIDFVIGGDDNE